MLNENLFQDWILLPTSTYIDCSWHGIILAFNAYRSRTELAIEANSPSTVTNSQLECVNSHPVTINLTQTPTVKVIESEFVYVKRAVQ